MLLEIKNLQLRDVLIFLKYLIYIIINKEYYSIDDRIMRE